MNSDVRTLPKQLLLSYDDHDDCIRDRTYDLHEATMNNKDIKNISKGN